MSSKADIPDCEVDVVRQSELWAALPGAEAQIARAARLALDVAGMAAAPGAEIAVLLADDAAVRVLNRTWRGIDRATNVLSFPAATPAGAAHRATHLGDIALAFETVSGEAAAEGKTLGDHVTHLVVHGVLHLLGHDHQGRAAAEAMEALEVQALARLGIADPYVPAASLSDLAADGPTGH
jgi:probable rRNA maturation factor